ncbi:MAG: Mov34/MPN/PAD-1 family protein [Myxococcales bacterium]|nr:Mov34/MPN/PAD-1 family protein [Myxococcales bacterium]
MRRGICRDVESRYPYEACGVVLGDRCFRGKEAYPLPNISQTPLTHFRIDEDALFKVVLQGQQRGLEWVATYHSHPDANAYLSEEDRRGLMMHRDPLFPRIRQLVVEVRAGVVGTCAGYGWSEVVRDYVLFGQEAWGDAPFSVVLQNANFLTMEENLSMEKTLNRMDRLRLMRFACTFAWADLTIADGERRFIYGLLAVLGLENEKSQVDGWLESPPPAEEVDPTLIPVRHRRLFLEAAKRVFQSDGVISDDEREVFELLEALL